MKYVTRLTPEEYQDTIIELSKYYSVYGTDKALPTYSHGLFEECGEVAGLLKRYYRGDVLAYLTLVAHTFDIYLETVMVQNIEKIQARKDSGTLTGTGNDR